MWKYLKVIIFHVATLGYLIVSPPNLFKNPAIAIVLYGLTLGQTFFVGMKIKETDEVNRLPILIRTFMYSSGVLLAIYLIVNILIRYQVMLRITVVALYVVTSVIGAVLIIGSAMTLGTVLSLLLKAKQQL